jgi:excisionase family DNA binding protein
MERESNMLNLTTKSRPDLASLLAPASSETFELEQVQPASVNEPDQLLNAKQLQAALCMSRAKVYRMMQDGTLPTVRVGGSVRVPRRALFQWIEDNTKPGRRVAV